MARFFRRRGSRRFQFKRRRPRRFVRRVSRKRRNGRRGRPITKASRLYGRTRTVKVTSTFVWPIFTDLTVPFDTIRAKFNPIGGGIALQNVSEAPTAILNSPADMHLTSSSNPPSGVAQLAAYFNESQTRGVKIDVTFIPNVLDSWNDSIWMGTLAGTELALPSIASATSALQRWEEMYGGKVIKDLGGSLGPSKVRRSLRFRRYYRMKNYLGRAGGNIYDSSVPVSSIASYWAKTPPNMSVNFWLWFGSMRGLPFPVNTNIGTAYFKITSYINFWGTKVPSQL